MYADMVDLRMHVCVAWIFVVYGCGLYTASRVVLHVVRACIVMAVCPRTRADGPDTCQYAYVHVHAHAIHTPLHMYMHNPTSVSATVVCTCACGTLP